MKTDIDKKINEALFASMSNLHREIDAAKRELIRENRSNPFVNLLDVAIDTVSVAVNLEVSRLRAKVFG